MKRAVDDERRWTRWYARRPPLLYPALFFAAYLLAGGLGQGLAIIPGVTITFWPPAGIFVATLLLNPRPQWPWYVLAGGLAELACNSLWFRSSIPLALVYYAANALEALAAAWLIHHFLPKPFRFESLPEVAGFAALAAGVAPTVGATVIAVADALLGKHPFTTAWPLVWLGDATGLLVSTPLTFVAVQAWRDRANIPPRRLVEAGALVLVLLGVGVLAFEGYLPTAYMTMPLLLWAAVRFQLKGAAVALGLITLLTAAYTVTGEGEFAGRPELLRNKVVMLQTFLGVSAVSALLAAALSVQRQQALRALQTVNAELEARVAERTAALRDSESYLREAGRRKDEFLATLAHELRNPLAPIRNAVQILNRRETSDPAIQAAREMIDRQVRHMVRLIDDLLDVSRITRGKLELRTERVTLAAVVEQALEASRPHAEAAGHDLTVSLPAEPVYLDADPVRLAQVLANLLNNACKYTERGGKIRLSAELTSAQASGGRQPPGHEASGQPDRSPREILICDQGADAPRSPREILICVQDNGIGIAREHLPGLFEMFSQVSSALERSQGGLGIGLALVRGLVEMHGGKVAAHSDGPGTGSTFTVRLPVLAEVPEAKLSPSGNPDGLRDGKARRVLVVDDNRDSAESLAVLLRLTGNEVRTAHDGQEGVEAAELFRPDVVLLDLGMPKVNGFEACRHIRGQPWGQGMVLIAQTGWGGEADRQRTEEAGFDGHLVKPVDFAALQQLLAIRSARQPTANQ